MRTEGRVGQAQVMWRALMHVGGRSAGQRLCGGRVMSGVRFRTVGILQGKLDAGETADVVILRCRG